MLTHHTLAAYLALGRIVERAGNRLRAQHGQGTIEYVGLMLMMSVLLAGVVTAARKSNDGGLTEIILDKVKGAIDGIGDGSGKG